MKLIETRPVQEEVCLMSWSPKMDLIALGTCEGNLLLHRLSWQKVWQIKLVEGNSEGKKLSLMTWHPDGVFLAVAAGSTTYVVDIEGGKIVHTHEMRWQVEAIKWCASEYELSMEEVHATKARQRSDFLRNELKLQRLELFLSALLIGTENGLIHVFTGGFLFAMTLKIPTELNIQCILQIDATRDLQSYHVMLVQNDDTGKFLSYTHFRTENFKKVSSSIGSLGFKYLFMAKNWSLIQSELNSLNDQWSKFVDIYSSYMTFGSDKNLSEVRADYMELLLTGICTVELEMFIGNIGREKDIKKHTNMINSISSSISEHMRTVKSAIVSLLIELNEIAGFLLVSRTKEAKEIVARLRKAFNYVYLGFLHIERLIQDAAAVFLHFFHLLLNTIHLSNAQEVQELGEEESDVDKVLEFLNMKIEKNVFHFLLQNAEDKFKQPLPCLEHITTSPPPATSRKIVVGDAKGPPFPFLKPCPDQKWLSFPELIQEYANSKPNGFPGESIILDFSARAVMELFSNDMPQKISKMFDELLQIPTLSTMPFAANTYALASLSCWGEEDVKMNSSGLIIKQSSASLCSYLTSPNGMSTFVFEFNFVEKSPYVRSYRLQFSSKITDCDIFSDSFLTIVSTVSDEDAGKTGDQDNLRAIVFQVNMDKLDPANTIGIPVDLNKFVKSSKQKSIPAVSPGEIPLDLSSLAMKSVLNCSSSSSAEAGQHPFIEGVAFVDGFCPLAAAVSGPRKLGALLSDSKKFVALIDMEPESGDNSYDDEVTAEFSFETLAEVSLQNL